MKTILFYFNSMTPAGGIERVIATLANRFVNFMEVTILVKDQAYSHYPLDQRIKIVSLDNEVRFDMNNKFNRIIEVIKNLSKNQKKLNLFLKNNKFDYYYIAHPLNAMEFHFAKGIDKSVVITEHGGIDAYNYIYKKIKAWLYPKAKCYVVPTKTDTELYNQNNFNAIYLPHFRSDLDYSKSEQSKNIALTIGRITEAKRQWILIDLWDRIVNMHKIKNWTLHIVGDGNLKEQYLKKINDLNLISHVQVLPPSKNVEKYYKNASFFLLTSQSEGFGMVILESMSFGVPCISYDCPSGPRDMINDKFDGYLVPFDNFQILEKCTLDLITDHEKLKRFGDNAFKSSKNWDDKIILEKWKKILH